MPYAFFRSALPTFISFLFETVRGRVIGYQQTLAFLRLLHALPPSSATPAKQRELFVDFVHRLQVATRNYARRQMSAFRAEPLFQWVR